ncbi:MAG: Rrf2 family transcriptional regulator [Clostridiales bacterium]|jgi:Rrf2 family protein|nr:Rrf2 family transcriptional regulator [Clostridiales bacterium]
MRISAKARYALACAVTLARKFDTGDFVTAVSLADDLQISKIYLEQVFALLKRAGVVVSSKGAGGGYRLSDRPAALTALDVLSATDALLTESAEETVARTAPGIETVMRGMVFDAMDRAIAEALGGVTLQALAETAAGLDGEYMYYL